MANIFINGELTAFQSVREAKAFLAAQAPACPPKAPTKTTNKPPAKPKADE